MKFTIANTLLLLTAPLAMAATAEQKVVKPVLISYPKDTPPSILEEAKNAIIEAGGVITHEFNLIKGFAADAPAKILESLQALEAHSGILIEEDQVIRVSDS